MHHALRALSLVAVAALWGCGGADIERTAVTGSVSSVGLAGPSVALYQVTPGSLDTDSVSIVIADAPATCADLTTIGLFGRSGVSARNGLRKPSLFLQSSRSEWATDGRTVGDDLLAKFDSGGCIGFTGCSNGDLDATDGSASLVETDDPGSGGVAKGSFDLAFTGGALKGTYVATPCSNLSSGCSAAGGAVLWPLVVLALFRRRQAPQEPRRFRGGTVRG